MERLDLGGLFLHFLVLWFVAIGGPSAILPDIHRYVVEAQHLLTNKQFAEIYTLAQVAPGPNAMYVTLIGWYLAGWKGAPRPRSHCWCRRPLLHCLSAT